MIPQRLKRYSRTQKSRDTDGKILKYQHNIPGLQCSQAKVQQATFSKTICYGTWAICHTEDKFPTPFFSQQPGTKGCPHQTTLSNPDGTMKDKVREQVTSIVDADLLSQLDLKAGCVKDHTTNWKSVTTDSVIRDAIQHHHVEFQGHCRPAQATKPRPIIFFIWEQRNHKP